MLSVMVCPPGFLCSQGLARDPQRSATLCPRGFYCRGGGIVSHLNTILKSNKVINNTLNVIFWQDPNPIPCPNGTYSEFPGLRDVTDCAQCPEGSYCYSQNPQEQPITSPVRSHMTKIDNILKYSIIHLLHFHTGEKRCEIFM